MPLKRHNRLLVKDFKILQSQKGFWAKSALLSVKSVKSNLSQSRFGFVVSARVSKKAVERNKMKRRLKDVVRKNMDNIKAGFDVIVIASPLSNKAKYQIIKEDLMGLLKKLKLLNNV